MRPAAPVCRGRGRPQAAPRAARGFEGRPGRGRIGPALRRAGLVFLPAALAAPGTGAATGLRRGDRPRPEAGTAPNKTRVDLGPATAPRGRVIAARDQERAARVLSAAQVVRVRERPIAALLRARARRGARDLPGPGRQVLLPRAVGLQAARRSRSSLPHNAIAGASCRTAAGTVPDRAGTVRPPPDATGQQTIGSNAVKLFPTRGRCRAR